MVSALQRIVRAGNLLARLSHVALCVISREGNVPVPVEFTEWHAVLTNL
jgi:hypothetical protein